LAALLDWLEAGEVRDGFDFGALAHARGEDGVWYLETVVAAEDSILAIRDLEGVWRFSTWMLAAEDHEAATPDWRVFRLDNLARPTPRLRIRSGLGPVE